VYKGDSNATSSSVGNPAEQVLVEELEAPGGPEDGYSTDSLLSRETRALRPAIEDWTSATQRRPTSLWWRLQL